MSLGLESGPPEPPSVKGRKRLSPWTLDLPQPFLSPHALLFVHRRMRPRARLAAALPARTLFYIFIRLGGRTGFRRRPRDGLGWDFCLSVFPSEGEEEKPSELGCVSVLSGDV